MMLKHVKVNLTKQQLTEEYIMFKPKYFMEHEDEFRQALHNDSQQEFWNEEKLEFIQYVNNKYQQ